MKCSLTLSFFLILSFSCFAQIRFSTDFRQGICYLKNGEKRVGLIDFDYFRPLHRSIVDKDVRFKTSKKADPEHILVKDIAAITLVSKEDTSQIDSFAPIHPHDKRIGLYYQTDLVEVVLNTIPMKLYRYYWISNTGGVFMVPINIKNPAYTVGESPDLSVAIHRSNLIDLMSKVVSDDPELLAAIQHGDYGLGSIDRIIKIYKSKRKGSASQVVVN